MNYSSHRIIFLFNMEIGKIFVQQANQNYILFTFALVTLGSIILTKQLPPGEVGHKEVTHVEDADDDAHGPHGQTRIIVPENKTKYYKF